VLYLAIPAHNEDATIGVLLWRLRTVLAEFPREYEVVVYDDASTDDTAAVAAQYAHAMPVTVLRGTVPVGYAGAVNALARHIAGHTRYPRRDAMLLLQGDFTDPPGIVPEFARRFEGGADLVVGERTAVVDAPVPVRRLFRAAGWALKPFVRVEGIRDLTGSMRLIRISALRDLLRAVGDDAVCEGDSWTANADLLLRLVPHARRIETVPVEPTYGVRTRETRRVTVRDALAALRWGWRARGRRAVPSSTPEAGGDTAARTSRAAGAAPRREETDVTAERLRERSRERERHRGDAPTASASRREGRSGDGRRDRERRDAVDATAADEPKSTRRQSAAESTRAARPEGERTPRPPRAERATAERATTERPPRERPPTRGRTVPTAADADTILDDPFAAPGTRDRAPVPAARSGAPPAEPTSQPSVGASAADDPTVVGAPRPSGVVRSEAVTDAVTEDVTDADTDADAIGDEGADDTAGVTRERKRRRNRRSRRRKTRQSGDADEASASSDQQEAEDQAGDDQEARDRGDEVSESGEAGVRTPREARSRARKRRGNSVNASAGEAGSETSVDRGAHGSADADLAPRQAAREDTDNTDVDEQGEDTGEELGDEASAARARRRGRRGRRGGARRSRGRGRDGGPAGDAEAGGAEPPPASPGAPE